MRFSLINNQPNFKTFLGGFVKILTALLVRHRLCWGMSFDFDHSPQKDVDPATCPVLLFGAGHALWLTAEGEIEDLSLIEAQDRLSDHLVLTVNSPKIMRQLGLGHVRCLDILELAAFCEPAAGFIPSMRGLADWLGERFLGPDLMDSAQMIRPFTMAILGRIEAKFGARPNRAMGGIAAYMANADWPWGPVLTTRLGITKPEGLMVWARFKEWEDSAPQDPPGDMAVDPAFAQARLEDLLGPKAESRPEQQKYCDKAAANFQPRHHPDSPNVSILEAGTGTGKTLGYVAPASLWAEQNKGPVWISTYTKNLQRQIDQELARLYPDATDKDRFAVIRKGRENYLCLLNMEEALGITSLEARAPRDRVLMGFVLRWLMETRDGDMVGGDFPAWLGAWFGLSRVLSLTDRRGECVYAACQHYRKCFVEKARRRTRHARLIIANHALVLHEAAAQGSDTGFARRYVFDEGHHLFDAADSAFSIHLTGSEMADLRRWIKGKEGRTGGRARGLKARLSELQNMIQDLGPMVDEVDHAAGFLASPGWLKRVHGTNPMNSAETFLMQARAHVFARDAGRSGPHGLEASFMEPSEDLIESAQTLKRVLDRLSAPLIRLASKLHKHLTDEDGDDLSSSDRGRLESLARSVAARADLVANGWVPMLEAIGGETPPGYVDWMAVDRHEGREYDLGLHRHFVDPTEPFSKVVLAESDSAIITSATLRDKAVMADESQTWRSADVRTGAHHLVMPPARHSYASPFDYGAQTRVMVITDVNKQDAAQVAAAFRALFQASGGGALGLFTAIKRLRTIYDRIAPDLEAAHIPLYAQHVDPMDTGTLVDMFRHEENACLLGTDALRDGVDVPGNSLRLLVFDRVPWPRPNLLHRARRGHFEGRTYDEMLVRLRLKQAFGRLIRRRDDKGVFVMLDAATPSRLLDAFPEGVTVERLGLAEALAHIADFLGVSGSDGLAESIKQQGSNPSDALSEGMPSSDLHSSDTLSSGAYSSEVHPSEAHSSDPHSSGPYSSEGGPNPMPHVKKSGLSEDTDPFTTLDETFQALNDGADDIPF